MQKQKWWINYLGLLGIWTIYRLFFRFAESLDEFFFKPVIWLTIFGLSFGWWRGLGKELSSIKGWLVGAVFGVFLGVYKIQFDRTIDLWIYGAAVSLATALVEEIVFRKILWNEQKKYGIGWGILLNVASFGLFHLPIYLAGGYSPAAIVGLLLMVMMTGGVYLAAYNVAGLSASVGAHLVWNLLSFLVL